MNLNNLHSIFFIGIGGIGMSALARYFKAKGCAVAGYDKTPSPLTEQLLSEGINIRFDANTATLPENIDMVVYTPAVPQTMPLFEYFKQQKVNIEKRSAVLGYLSEQGKTVAVAGTHGKTSISSIIAHLLYHSPLGCNAFLGGITKNYGSNLLLSPESEIVVAEADEYDRSFLKLHPWVSVISSMDADHLDIYNDYETLASNFNAFAERTHKEGSLIINYKIREKLKGITHKNIKTYGFDSDADFKAFNLRNENGFQVFDLKTPDGQSANIQLKIPGLMNVENATAAIAAALTMGVSMEDIQQHIPGFLGIKRRFELVFQSDKITYIDDYAHHPEEINALLTSVRKLYLGRKVLGIFQPHLFSRTRDFADDFGVSLSKLDEVILLPIYPAREEPIPGITSNWLLSKISNNNKKLLSPDKLTTVIRQSKPDVLLTIGAGNIDRTVKPIHEFLKINFA